MSDLIAQIDKLSSEVATHQTERALAEQRMVVLEREVERLQGALHDVVERFTRPELPDLPDPSGRR